MRKLNYDIAVGTVFELPSMSWQVHEVKGNYRVEIDDIDRWGEIYCQCVNLDNEYAPKILIPKMCIAFLLAEEVPAEANVAYSGREYQPSGLDDFRYAQEDGDYDGDFPFWYCGHCGDKRAVRCDMWIGNWCYFKLPWD
jgi:hypothetical protein